MLTKFISILTILVFFVLFNSADILIIAQYSKMQYFG